MTTAILLGLAALALSLLLIGARRRDRTRPDRKASADDAGWTAADAASDRDDAEDGGGGNEGGGDGGGGDGGGD